MQSFTILLVLSNVFPVDSAFLFPWLYNRNRTDTNPDSLKSITSLKPQTISRSSPPLTHVPSKPIPIPFTKGDLIAKQRNSINHASPYISSNSFGRDEDDEDNEHPEFFLMSCDPDFAAVLKAGEERKKLIKLAENKDKKVEQQQQKQQKGVMTNEVSYFDERDAAEAEYYLNSRRARFNVNQNGNKDLRKEVAESRKDSDFDGNDQDCYSLSM